MHTSLLTATYASLEWEQMIRLLVSIMVASMFFVISSSKIIYSVFFLILVYLCSFPLILLLGFDFLATALVIIYVGAVVIFFIFILMSCQLQGIAVPTVPSLWVGEETPLPSEKQLSAHTLHQSSASIGVECEWTMKQSFMVEYPEGLGAAALNRIVASDFGRNRLHQDKSSDRMVAQHPTKNTGSASHSTFGNQVMSLRYMVYGLVPVFVTLGIEYVGSGDSGSTTYTSYSHTTYDSTQYCEAPHHITLAPESNLWNLGNLIYNHYWVHLYLIGVLLLVAMIGAVVLFPQPKSTKQ